VLSLAPSPTIFFHTDATDMRKSFTGLCGLIRGVFGDDPADGSLFLFVNSVLPASLRIPSGGRGAGGRSRAQSTSGSSSP